MLFYHLIHLHDEPAIEFAILLEFLLFLERLTVLALGPSYFANLIGPDMKVGCLFKNLAKLTNDRIKGLIGAFPAGTNFMFIRWVAGDMLGDPPDNRSRVTRHLHLRNDRDPTGDGKGLQLLHLIQGVMPALGCQIWKGFAWESE